MAPRGMVTQTQAPETRPVSGRAGRGWAWKQGAFLEPRRRWHETLPSAGPLFLLCCARQARQARQALPVPSLHFALHQSLPSLSQDRPTREAQRYCLLGTAPQVPGWWVVLRPVTCPLLCALTRHPPAGTWVRCLGLGLAGTEVAGVKALHSVLFSTRRCLNLSPHHAHTTHHTTLPRRLLLILELLTFAVSLPFFFFLLHSWYSTSFPSCLIAYTTTDAATVSFVCHPHLICNARSLAGLCKTAQLLSRIDHSAFRASNASCANAPNPLLGRAAF